MQQINIDRQLKPQLAEHDNMAERLILGNCIFEGPNTFAKAKCFISTPDIFYTDDHKKIWLVMEKLYDDGANWDNWTITRVLTLQGKSLSGDKWGYIIAKCIEPITGSVFMQNYCLAAVEDCMKRTTRDGIYRLAGNADPLEVAKEIDESLKKALNMNSYDDWKDASQVAMKLIDRREKIKNGEIQTMLTGFKEFDLITGGLESGFIVIAARPSMGKTAFATSLIVNLARNNVPVGILSLEMPDVQIAARIASIYSGVQFWRIFRNKHDDQQSEDNVNKSICDMGSLPIYISDKTGVNFHDIRYKIERLVKSKGAKCIIIDYLQLVDGDGMTKNESREREVAKLSNSLKNLSSTLDIPIIALAQLNRESEKTQGNSRPGKLSQLRESGSIEQNADIGIIIDRPWKRGELVDEHGNSTENVADIIIEKFRNGETSTIRLHYDGPTMMFKNKPGEEIYKVEPTKITPSSDHRTNPPQISLTNEPPF